MDPTTRLPNISVALVQTTLAWHDCAANLKRFSSLLQESSVLSDGDGADLIVLPEMFSTGFTMDAESQAEDEECGPAQLWMKEQAKKYNAVVTGSVIVRLANSGGHRNRLLWVQPDGKVLHYDKRHLFRMAGENEIFEAGQEQALFHLKGWGIRPLVCYDLRFPLWSRDSTNTDLLLYTASWPGPRRAHWNCLVQARAIENLCYVVAVNRVGQDGKGIVYTGDSQVINANGETVLNAGSKDGVFKVSLDIDDLLAYRARFPAHLDADSFKLL
eukprot:gene14570-17223_t